MRRSVAAEPEGDAPEAPAADQQQRGDDEPPPSGRRGRMVARALLARAERARKDPVEFFSFVMREEKTHAKIRCAAHQRVLLQFVMSFERCVVRMPVGSSKTFSMAALTLWLLGNDPTERGAVISASEGQAEKPLSMVADYIEDEQGWYPELRLVFPELRPSPRAKDPWTQSKIVVDRPPGIRDPSLVAVGEGGKLPGSRLSWIIVDDVLNEENTRTPAARAKVIRWFNSTVLSRKDIDGSRIVVTNTPWHPQDLTYALEKAGWPTLTMDVEGNITLSNVGDWDSDDIRPAWLTRGEVYRLAAHDAEKYGAPMTRVDPRRGERVRVANDTSPAANDATAEPFDLDEVVPLWPEVYSAEKIEGLRASYANAIYEFNQLYRCLCRDDEDAPCKVAWIDACKRLAVRAGFHTLVSEYRGPWATVTGVDLAIGEDEKHDWTALFTFALVPELEVDGKRYRNLRLVLDVDVGRYRGRTVVDKIIAKTTRYGSIVRVETNAGQDFLRQWTLDVDAAVPVRAHATGKNKHARVHGVAGVFIELENGAWLIPNDPKTGEVAPAVQRWIEECLYYRPPPAHTGDVLMASWLARAQAREVDAMGGGGQDLGRVAAAVAAR